MKVICRTIQCRAIGAPPGREGNGLAAQYTAILHASRGILLLCMCGRVSAVIGVLGRALAASPVRYRVGGILSVSPAPVQHWRRAQRCSSPVSPAVRPEYLRPHLSEALVS